MFLEPARQVQRDDVDVEALTCLLERALVCRPRSDKIILLLQLRNAEVGGVIGQEDVASSQYAQALGDGKRQGIGYW